MMSTYDESRKAFMNQDNSDSINRGILKYLSAAHHLNPEAEVSGAELQYKLGLDAATMAACVSELARLGLVEWDPLLSNIWLRLTDKGLAAAERLEREER